MRIGIQTWGSTGDCRPMFALARELKLRGHEVTYVVTCLAGNSFSEEARKLFIQVKEVPEKLPFQEEDFQNTFGSAQNDLFLLIRLLNKGYFSIEEELMQSSLELARECDVLISHFLIHTLKIAAGKFGKPCATVHFWPGSLATGEAPPGPIPFNLGPRINTFFWNQAHTLLNLLFEKRFARLAIKHKVPVSPYFPDWWDGRQEMCLIGASPHLWKPPKDWPESFQMSGFWDLPPDSRRAIPDEMKEFLNSGSPPVLISFGSMGYVSPVRNQAFLEATSQMLDERILLQSANPELEDGLLSPKVYRFKSLPHSLLFPHIRAMVHHGGAGTTHSSAKAGIPSLIVSFCEEQYSWGLNLHKLRLGPKPLRKRKLSPQLLAHKIRELLRNPTYALNAQKLGNAMQEENGVQLACETIEGLWKDSNASESKRYLLK